jgi:Zn-dependent protease
MLISLLFQEPMIFFMVALSLVVCISIHEFAHAYSALKLGDPTAESMGRVTLNPLSHLDPLGTVLLLVAGFGWGRPVPFNPGYLKHPKRDAAIISFAGPLSNFILAFLFAGLIRLVDPSNSTGALLYMIFYYIIFFNLILGFFNLLPLHPLDGFKVVNGFLPDSLSYQWMQMAPYGIFILIFLIFTGTTATLLGSFINFAMNFLGLQAFF